MPRIGPGRRLDLIRCLHQLGFEGPYSGGRHQFMQRGDVRLMRRNPHRGDIAVEFLMRLLREADVTRAEWKRL